MANNNNNNNNNIRIRGGEESSSAGSGSSNRTTVSRTVTSNLFSPSKVNHIQDESGVTYRVVEIPSDLFLNQNNQISALAQTQNITADGASSGAGQPVFINAANLVSSEPKIAYLPSNAITVASPIQSSNSTQFQLRAVDGGGGQYYIMLPPSDGGSQSNPSSATRSTIVGANTAPRVQQAAFIPLSKFDPGSSVQAATVSVNRGFLGSNESRATPPKETKRRVSHNEVEKRRRDKINSWINKLARLVPTACEDVSKQGQQSKGGVLAKTVDYINELRSSNVQLNESLKSSTDFFEQQRLRQQVADLQKENKLLKQKLIDNNIAVPQTQTQQSQVQMFGGGKRLIPVTMTSNGTVLLMSSSSSSGSKKNNVDHSDEEEVEEEEDDDHMES